MCAGGGAAVQADILESIFASPVPTPAAMDSAQGDAGSGLPPAHPLNHSASSASSLAAGVTNAAGGAALLDGGGAGVVGALQEHQLGATAAAVAAAAGLSAADVENLLRLAARQAGRDDELAAALAQVGGVGCGTRLAHLHPVGCHVMPAAGEHPPVPCQSCGTQHQLLQSCEMSNNCFDLRLLTADLWI